MSKWLLVCGATCMVIACIPDAHPWERWLDLWNAMLGGLCLGVVVARAAAPEQETTP